MEQIKENEKFPSKILYGRTVISQTGKKLGKIKDIIFETKTGELLFMVLDDYTDYVNELNVDRDNEGYPLIPFAAVIAIGDFVVVNEEEII
ncbi:MAG: PRC-barrel domain-containing protein [Nanoarchaeota archaeon]